MSNTTEEETPALPGDGLREGIVDELRRRIGDALVDSHLRPNDDLWMRVIPEAWRRTGEALLAMGFDYFCFLSAIDWLPSPFGRGEDDPTQPPPERSTEVVHGYTGGDTRFQVLARVIDTTRHVGVTLKADVPDEPFALESWHTVYAGANWHERETHEMFGIGFNGHPDLRNIYLPTEFEGFPLRKDFPLLSRIVKPWPGIVDVEPMPAEEAPPEEVVTGPVEVESATPEQADAGVGEAPDMEAAEGAAEATSPEEAPSPSAVGEAAGAAADRTGSSPTNTDATHHDSSVDASGMTEEEPSS